MAIIQRFGAALNLNIHVHALVIDGVYVEHGPAVRFRECDSPTDDEMDHLLDTIERRLRRLLARRRNANRIAAAIDTLLDCVPPERTSSEEHGHTGLPPALLSGDRPMDKRIVESVSEGYQLGYSQHDAESGIPLEEPWLSYYLQGLEAGREARRQADAQFGGPTIGPDPGGESWNHYRRRWKELLEPIFHEHMPHTEIEMNIPEPPPMNQVR